VYDDAECLMRARNNGVRASVLWIAMVRQHSKRSLPRPPSAGVRCAERCADMSIEGVHHAAGAVGGSNLKTYARVVKLNLKIFYLTSPARGTSSAPLAIPAARSGRDIAAGDARQRALQSADSPSRVTCRTEPTLIFSTMSLL
jgi:hypothetical protein